MKSLFALFAVGVLLLSACGREETTHVANKEKKFLIGVSIPAATHGWTGGVVWCAEQAKKKLETEHSDVEYLLTTGQNTEEQINRIENLLSRKIDALVVMTQEPGPVSPVCETAKQQGVYLVIVSNPLDRRIEDLFVNGSNTSFGQAAARAMGNALDGQGEILIMEGVPCPINTERVDAFREELKTKFPKIRILESQAAYWNTEKGLSLMETFLQKYSHIDGVWAGDDDVLQGAINAYQDSKRTDIKAMIGGGGSKNIVKLIKENDPLVKATVTYPPHMVAVGMEEALSGLRNGGKPIDGKKEKTIASEIIVKENAEQYYHPDSMY